MRTYGNDWLQQLDRSRREGRYVMGYWPRHEPRLNRRKKLTKQSGKPRCRKT